MFKRILSVGLLAGALVVGGCQNSQTVDATTVAADITSGIKSACGFSVTAETALQLAGLAASPFVAGSAALANFLSTTIGGVCATLAPPATTASSVRPGAPRTPTYGGVPIVATYTGK